MLEVRKSECSEYSECSEWSNPPQQSTSPKKIRVICEICVRQSKSRELCVR